MQNGEQNQEFWIYSIKEPTWAFLLQNLAPKPHVQIKCVIHKEVTSWTAFQYSSIGEHKNGMPICIRSGEDSASAGTQKSVTVRTLPHPTETVTVTQMGVL